MAANFSSFCFTCLILVVFVVGINSLYISGADPGENLQNKNSFALIMSIKY